MAFGVKSFNQPRLLEWTTKNGKKAYFRGGGEGIGDFFSEKNMRISPWKGAEHGVRTTACQSHPEPRSSINSPDRAPSITLVAGAWNPDHAATFPYHFRRNCVRHHQAHHPVGLRLAHYDGRRCCGRCPRQRRPPSFGTQRRYIKTPFPIPVWRAYPGRTREERGRETISKCAIFKEKVIVVDEWRRCWWIFEKIFQDLFRVHRTRKRRRRNSGATVYSLGEDRNNLKFTMCKCDSGSASFFQRYNLPVFPSLLRFLIDSGGGKEVGR